MDLRLGYYPSVAGPADLDFQQPTLLMSGTSVSSQVCVDSTGMQQKYSIGFSARTDFQKKGLEGQNSQPYPRAKRPGCPSPLWNEFQVPQTHPHCSHPPI